ncbi:MAG: hypothetical protein GOV00_01215 [Candidatus Altiarchaeota archaeon]|nr:hypothetical protein [Candidatus Altiarchaeota archaeon]
MRKWLGALTLGLLVILAGCTEAQLYTPTGVLTKVVNTLPMGWESVYAPRNSTKVFDSFRPWLVNMREVEIKKSANNQSKTLRMSIMVFETNLVAERFIAKIIAENAGYDSGITGLPTHYSCFGVRQDETVGETELQELSLCRTGEIVVSMEAIGDLDETLSTQMMGKIILLIDNGLK